MVDSVSHAGIAEALVVLYAPGVSSADQVRTTDAGDFVFRHLPPGRWEIGAVTTRHQGTSGRRTVVDLVEGQVVTDVQIAMKPFAALGGVVRDERGEPVPGVTVRMARRYASGLWANGSTTTTNDIGEYRFSSLVPDDYMLYVPSTQLTLTTSGRAALQEAAAVSSEELTDLIEGLRPAGFADSAGLRFAALQWQDLLLVPGGVVKPPVAREAGRLVYDTVFHPGSDRPAQAQPVTLALGESREGVDFQLRPVPATTVRGQLIFEDGTPAGLLAVTLSAADPGRFSEPPPTAATVSERTGAFSFPLVPAGDYVIRVQKLPRPPPAATSGAELETGTERVLVRGTTPRVGRDALAVGPLFWAELPLAVPDATHPVDAGRLTVRRGARASGRIVFDGDSPIPPETQILRSLVQLRLADGRAGAFLPGRFDETGEFLTPELPPGRYVVWMGQLGAWGVRSITLDGRDVADEPFDLGAGDVSGITVVYSDRLPSVTGAVRDDQGRAVPDATVVIFPAERQYWENGGAVVRRTTMARSANGGTYSIGNVPAGDYCVVALDDDPPTDWRTPVQLARLLPQATRVSLAEGQRAHADLRLAGSRGAPRR